MGAVVLAHAALLGATALWPLIDRTPQYRVACTISEIFPGGGKTQRGSFIVVLHKDAKAGVQSGCTPLEGAWLTDPTLSVRIKAVDTGEATFPLDVHIQSHIGDRACGLGWVGEDRNAFVMKLPKADDSEGCYEFQFHRQGRRWYQALLP